MKNLGLIIAVFALSVVAGFFFFNSFNNQPSENKEMTEKLKQFITSYEQKVAPLFRDAGIAYFNATISGKEEDYNRSAELTIALSKVYTNKADYKILADIRDSKGVTDPLLARQLEKLYLLYKSNQMDEKKQEEIINLSTAIENRFSTYRTTLNGKQVSDNDIETILSESTSSIEVENAWRASKELGPVVAADVIKLVKMRNEAAREMGFPNYHTMSLQISEQDPKEIDALMDELDKLTAPEFKKLKAEIDGFLANRFGIPTEQLMPWHYQNRFFQEAPKIYNVDLDTYYKDVNIEEVTTKYYAGLGLPIDKMIAASDLYEKPGKYQHAYCTHIDRSGDVRVVCNIKPNSKWMGTMLHEFGHGVYDGYLDFNLPYTLREPAHTFTTEAIAMLFGRMYSSPLWMNENIGLSKESADSIKTTTAKILKLEQLIFSRWVQVVYRFEKAMYANPDQDLNTLWWQLVEKYQLVKKPEGRDMPDWVTKIHIALYPAYYHNYQLGELLASQLQHYITTKVMKLPAGTDVSFTNNPEVGKYLRTNVFAPGTLYHWNDMIERATGEKLTAAYFAQQFVN